MIRNINDIPLQYFFIFVASVDPLSKNKSRIIIQKCLNFCKQLTLPGRTVQQLPFFKTVRLYTVIPSSDSLSVQKWIKLYNSMITPILTYGSEIWIVDHKINIENLHNLSFEKTQNMIMKQILGVHGKTPQSCYSCRIWT